MASERILRMAEESKKVNIYPDAPELEFDRMDYTLPEAVMNAKRLCEYMAAQEIMITEDMNLVGRIKFNHSVVGDIYTRNGYKHFREFADYFYVHHVEDLVIFEAQHSTAYYGDVLNHGIEGIKEKIRASLEKHALDKEKVTYLEALHMVCDGIIAWAERCADTCKEKAIEAASGERKDKLLAMEKTLRKVPRCAATSFEEAIQSLYICWHFCPDSIGVADRYLYPFFKKDIKSKKITEEDAKELLQELFVTINGWTPPTFKHAADKGGESHFAIGGYTEDGEDGFNDLSKLILDSVLELPLYRPQVSFRWTEKTKFETLKYVMKCEQEDPYKRIAIVSDTPRINAFQKISGLSYEEAVNYTMVGCNECALPGTICSGGITANMARCVEQTLYDCQDEACKCKNYEEFYELFERNLEEVIDKMVHYLNAFEMARTRDVDVLSSLFFQGPIEKGISLTKGGGKNCMPFIDCAGIICVIDSLSVIRQFVFDEKRITMEELLNAMKEDWKGYESLRNMILKEAKFFGNNEELSDEVARAFNESVYKMTSKHKSLFGGNILIGNINGYRQHNVWYGERTAATPDGRHAKDPFLIGIGQSGGKDREGITALLNSVAQMNPTGVFCGPSVFNVTIDKSFVRNEESFDKTVRLMETYLRNGGLQVQFNCVSREELLDAQKHPENYQNLRVRVSGFSAYFVGLSIGLQNSVIERTSQSM